MADNMVASYASKPITDKQKEKEFAEHTRTYTAFLQGAKWLTIATAVLLIILYFVFIA